MLWSGAPDDWIGLAGVHRGCVVCRSDGSSERLYWPPGAPGAGSNPGRKRATILEIETAGAWLRFFPPVSRDSLLLASFAAFLCELCGLRFLNDSNKVKALPQRTQRNRKGRKENQHCQDTYRDQRDEFICPVLQ